MLYECVLTSEISCLFYCYWYIFSPYLMLSTMPLLNCSNLFSGIQSYDIISTLQFLGMIKYWRGKHIILKKEYVINDYLERWDHFQLFFHGKVMRLM
jgi:hypothetical protein